MSSKDTESGIYAIRGEALSGVAFFQDYVEFHFDGKVVRSLTAPTLAVPNGKGYTFPEAGSRDALCSLIGFVVENVLVKENQHIELVFSGGYTARIPLEISERTGPEAAHYVPGLNQPIDVW